jgi:hypothetical protein
MTWSAHCAKGALLAAASLLGACATSVSVSDLNESNFGYRVMPHFDASADPDPAAINRGLYMPRSLQYSCYGCSSQSQLSLAGWAP